MKKWRDLSQDEVKQAYFLRGHGLSYAAIARRLGGYGLSDQKVKRALDGHYKRKRENPGPTNHKVMRHLDPFLPPAVQAEADTVAAIDWENLSPSQRYLGDPRPGRAAIDQLSAADRKRLGIE